MSDSIQNRVISIIRANAELPHEYARRKCLNRPTSFESSLATPIRPKHTTHKEEITEPAYRSSHSSLNSTTSLGSFKYVTIQSVQESDHSKPRPRSQYIVWLHAGRKTPIAAS